MANKQLFRSTRGKLVPAADAVNLAGGLAYKMSPAHAIAQYACTGCLNGTFYASGEEQLASVLAISEDVTSEFIAKTAIYSRKTGKMKDMPALLLARLSIRDPKLFEAIFNKVVDSPRMLRTFVQIMRSGVVGRKSMGSLPKRMVRSWLDSRSASQLFIGSVSNNPSIADIIKMVHPRPKTKEQDLMYRYLIGKGDAPAESLAGQYERFKATGVTMPDVPFQFLASCNLTTDQWKQIARNAPWNMTRMNINTFLRHGVFENDSEMIQIVSDRLSNPEMVRHNLAFPYQLLSAYCNTGYAPHKIREALQDAMEIATDNVPSVNGKVCVFPDVSGSMGYSVTGSISGAPSSVRCVDVAGLIASVMLRKNPDAEVIPFECDVVDVRLNPRDTVLTNAKLLASVGGGGTDCSAPLRLLNKRKAMADLLVYVSDNESWYDGKRDNRSRYGYFSGTSTAQEWSAFKHRNPQARMICIDLTPNNTTQAKEQDDVLNVGGFSDEVFNVIAAFAEGRTSKDYWVNRIESEEL